MPKVPGHHEHVDTCRERMSRPRVPQAVQDDARQTRFARQGDEASGHVLRSQRRSVLSCEHKPTVAVSRAPGEALGGLSRLVRLEHSNRACVQGDLPDTRARLAKASVTQQDGTARIVVTGDGDFDAAAAQVARFLSLDVDARTWPESPTAIRSSPTPPSTTA